MYNPYITISLGIVFVFVVPVIYYNYLQKKKTRKVLHGFSKVAEQRNLDMTFAESMPNLLIGLDATARKLLAIEGLNGENEQIVDLENLVSCDLHTDRIEPSGEIRLIALQFGSKTKEKQQIVFYNAGMEIHPDAERRLEAAEKWRRIISANIRK